MCKDKFRSKTDLAVHKRAHSVNFKCDKCPFKGISRKSLTIHNNKDQMQNNTLSRGTKRAIKQSPESKEVSKHKVKKTRQMKVQRTSFQGKKVM